MNEYFLHENEVGEMVSSGHLYKVPTMDEFSGEESYAYIRPTLVSILAPHQIEVGEEAPFTKTVKGTRVVSSEESYFVPLPLPEVANRLNLTIKSKSMLAQAATNE